jgi:hypothetical protein
MEPPTRGFLGNSKWLIRFIFINQLSGRLLHLIQYESGPFTTVPRKIHARISVAFVLGEIPVSMRLVEHAPKFGREIQGVLRALEYEVAIFRSVSRVLPCAQFPAFEVRATTSVI